MKYNSHFFLIVNQLMVSIAICGIIYPVYYGFDIPFLSHAKFLSVLESVFNLVLLFCIFALIVNLFIHVFCKCLLSTYSVPRQLLDARESAKNKT